MPLPPRAAIIGGGPAGLMAATVLAQAGANVTLYEQMPSVGRKLLMAGRGGLNLTHSEPVERFITRYREAAPKLEPIITDFSPADLVAWAEALGQETFVGSSGRVFPKAFKASPLLRAWLRQLATLNVEIRTRHQWLGFDPSGKPAIRDPAGNSQSVECDILVLALGGASWPRLGSTGEWRTVLEKAGIATAPFEPSNCGFTIVWSEHMKRFAGEPLKRIALSFHGETARGEVIVTQESLEGGPLYALSAPLRAAMRRKETYEIGAVLQIDLRPDLTVDQLAAKLAKRRAGESTSTYLRKAAGLSPVAIAVLRDTCASVLPTEPIQLARLIKGAPLRLIAPRPIERAISTAGGVRFDALDERLMLTALPGTFVAGEMLDWEAPTGGYLLQACFATGVAAAKGALDWWGENEMQR